MQKTFTGVLRDSYVAPRRRIFAYGRMIDFVDGVARGLSDSVARELLRRKILREIIPEYVPEELDVSEVFLSPDSGFVEPESVQVVTPEFNELQLESAVDVEPVHVSASEVEVVESVASSEFDVVEVESVDSGVVEDDAHAESMGITRELIESLYVELKTWTAVASHLGVTITRLKKYRDDLNL
jgi:hypothetical protein